MSSRLLLFHGSNPYSLNLSRTSKLCQEPIQIRLRIIRVLIQRNMKFEKAPEYASLEDVEGMVHENGWYILALGAETEDGLMVSVSSYSPDGSRLSFGRTGLRYREEVKGDSKEAGE